MSNRKQPRNSSGNRSKPTAATQRASAERAAAARARIEQAHRRRRLVVVGSVGAAVILVLAILVVVRLAVDTGPKSGQRAAAANDAVVTDVTSVPAATLNEIGAGTVRTLPKAISAPALTADGKPRILYVGAEYCPFCAAERWAVTVALARFGTFSGLGQTASSPSDVYPDTATLTFHGASLRSDVVSFTGKELQSNQVDGDSYATLDKLTAAENTLVEKYNAPPYVSSKGAIPFMDIGGRYVLSGASYDPQVLAGKSHAQIASALKEPSSAIAKAVDGTANVLTAAICRVTNGKPATVCSSAGVTAAAGKLGST